MKNSWDAVAEFMEAGGQVVGQKDWSVSERYSYQERVQSECRDTFNAVIRSDYVEIADSYADLIYAAMTGLLNLAGRDKAEQIFQAVVDANTTKIDGSLGPVRRDKNGKILKPAGFVPPNQKIKEILES